MDTATEWILGTVGTLAAAAFLAWARVVWNASSKAFAIADRFDKTLDNIVKQVDRLEQRLTQHEHADGHPTALAKLEGLQHEVTQLREFHREDLKLVRNQLDSMSNHP